MRTFSIAVVIVFGLLFAFRGQIDYIIQTLQYQTLALNVEEPEGDKFLRFVGTKDTDRESWERIWRANNCANYKEVIDKVQSRFDSRTPKQVWDAEGDYASLLVVEEMNKAVRLGTMSRSCLVRISDSMTPEEEVFVLLAPFEDYVIGYELPDDNGQGGLAVTPLSKVHPKGYAFDIMELADFTDGLSQAVYDEMNLVKIVPIGDRDFFDRQLASANR